MTSEARRLDQAAEAEALGRSLLDLAARIRNDTSRREPAPSPTERPAKPAVADPTTLARTVASLQGLRQRRLRHFGLALAGEAAWDLLLSLYEARLARRELSFYQLCATGGAYPATIRRWLAVLAGLGLIEVEGEGGDPVAERPRLTRKGEIAMTECLSGLSLPA
ncbi:hypothetical protein ACFOON_12975 [Novosphingobium piscinae]|uniref:HTH marR-type domain-containing protein n=1 Tax=Novosphingobium piscinae TaxID=1507448 RepID=A0A7X1KQL3_9SPHN|nr:hypothetical protein [Novosphingobium piscinae]MBC2669688.1 hypothetical protein [Novosphingobium piscinae]